MSTPALSPSQLKSQEKVLYIQLTIQQVAALALRIANPNDWVTNSELKNAPTAHLIQKSIQALRSSSDDDLPSLSEADLAADKVIRDELVHRFANEIDICERDQDMMHGLLVLSKALQRYGLTPASYAAEARDRELSSTFKRAAVAHTRYLLADEYNTAALMPGDLAVLDNPDSTPNQILEAVLRAIPNDKALSLIDTLINAGFDSLDEPELRDLPPSNVRTNAYMADLPVLTDILVPGIAPVPR